MSMSHPNQALRTVRKLLCAMIAVGPLLQGCSTGGDRKAADAEPTLADLKPAKPPETHRQLPQVGLTKVTENYRAVLKNTDDPDMRLRVTQRLADLQMLNSEQNQLATTQQGQHHFDDAIREYQALLVAHPNRPDNDKLMYQLSKAYDMDGRNDESLQILNRLVREYPQSSVIVEAQFRRGELLFARHQYADAENAYAAVVSKGENSTYYQNALYMHGWAQFKRSDYEGALGSFTQTLDKLWPADPLSSKNKLDGMSRTERELVNDTLRVMSLSFSNLEGAKTITETYRRLGERHYIPELYAQLGQLYLEQKRYRDAAETYRAFVDTHPLAPEAPGMYVHLIDAYAEGNFPSEVLAQKAAFIKLYGIHGAHSFIASQPGDAWAKLDEPARESVRGYLKDFLSELAQYHHGLAQQNKSALTKAAGAKGDKIPRDAAGEEITRAGVLQSYRLAGDYYREYIDSFPQAPDVGAKMFLLAESRFEAEDYPAAIDAYEIVAYQYTNNERGAEAGYSSLLAYELRGKQLAPEQQAAWQQRRTASELRFAKTYPQDRRAAMVQTHAAEELFARRDYVAAIAAATPVTQWQPPADEKLRRSAWLIIAHAYFEQQDFVQAEQGYRQASALIAANDPQRAEVQDRLAASVYKQGEQKLAGGDKAAAAQQFLRVAQVAPDSAIRVNAQYDAATQFMDGGNYKEAISTLNDLRAHFPDHALSAGVSNKLATAYLRTGQSAAAAAELTRVSQQDPDPATRREALLSAAELYQKAGDTNNAIARYRDYVQQYPTPFGPAMEARYQVTELLKTSGDKTLRRQWLDQIISADAAAGAQRSDRSRFLAAQAQDEIAEGAYQLFIGERLTLPLKESLKRKRAALDEALVAYQRSGDYGVQEFSTKAAYRIGDIYANLAQALTKSERPPNLSALELEQYEVLLEEQADPFVEKAISVHEGNIKRSWNGIYDDWVKKSFAALESLSPARYRKTETRISVSEEIN